MNATALDDYLGAVRRLWPEADEPQRVVGSDTPVPSSVDFRVIPHANAPRLLVPTRNRRAAARAMLRFSASLGPSDVAQRVIVAGLLRIWPTPLRHRVSAPSSNHSLLAYLADTVFKQRIDVSLGLGTARANRKPVLQVFDERGNSLAFVKLGVDAVSKHDVLLEEKSLARLEHAVVPESLEVPRILHAGDWHGNRVLVLSALRTRATLRSAKPTTIPIQAMEGVHRAFGSEVVPLKDAPKWRQLSSTASRIEDVLTRERFQKAIDSLTHLHGQRSVSVGSWHGDWTPWNMARGRRTIQLWDWERLETGVPWGLDICHFAVQTACRKNGMTSRTVLDALRAAEQLGQTRLAPARLSGGIYLATITARYLLSAQGLHGENIALGSRVMLDALEQWLTATDEHLDQNPTIP